VKFFIRLKILSDLSTFPGGRDPHRIVAAFQILHYFQDIKLQNVCRSRNTQRAPSSYCAASRNAQEWYVYFDVYEVAESHYFLGKQWHPQKTAFRPTSGLTSYEKRQEDRKATAAVKAKEKEMKDEKEAERQVGIFGGVDVCRQS
jgi:hypothetical protein